MGVRSDLFLDVLRNVRYGDLLRELSDELAEAVKAADAAGKQGKITLNLTFKPNGRGQMILTDSVNTTVPKGDAPATLMFNDAHGNLSRRDPNQGDLGLAAADEPTRGREHG